MRRISTLLKRLAVLNAWMVAYFAGRLSVRYQLLDAAVLILFSILATAVLCASIRAVRDQRDTRAMYRHVHQSIDHFRGEGGGHA